MKSKIFLLLLTISTSLFAQTDNTELHETIDNLYSVITGPAGPRDWDKFRSLFHEKAIMGTTRVNPEGVSSFFQYDPEGYIERNDPFFQENAFYEEELQRKVRVFGGVAQVFTSYQFRLQKDGPVVRRGINSISLIQSGEKWLITQLVWQEESPDLPLPTAFDIKN